MSNIQKLIDERNIPELLLNNRGKAVGTVKDFEKRRVEIKKLLEEKEYGVIPPKPEHLSVEILSVDPRFCAGKATLTNIKIILTADGKECSFPIVSVIPNKEGKYPAFVHINFSPDVPDKYMPTEEIIDNGFAVFSFCYKDVAGDDNDFKKGCAKFLCSSRRAANAPGKIAMWAWAAMRVMDYIESLDNIDSANVAVVGHSRLGKTALVTGGFDERFKFVISNESGCSGAAITRGKVGETREVITNVFEYWFCPRYKKEREDMEAFNFDQHFLLALSVPRHVIVGSAEEDLWADPASEFLALAAINPAYSIYGKRGLVHEDRIPEAKAVLGEGDSCYHVRHGLHYFSREDWQVYMDYIKANLDN